MPRNAFVLITETIPRDHSLVPRPQGGRDLATRPRPVGRPPIEPTEETTRKVCDLIFAGLSVRKVGEALGTPSTATIRRWIAEDEAFRTAYLRAKEAYCEDKLEECIDIADDAEDDFELADDPATGTVVVKPNKRSLGRSQLMIDTRFRVLGKLLPRKYGDQPQLEAPPAAPAIEPPRNGDGAKVIDGSYIPMEAHPMYDSIQAWGKVKPEGAK